jgi:arginine decarboxylase
MPKEQCTHPPVLRIDQFFAGLGARADQWRHLMKLAEAWAGGSGDRAKYESAFEDLAVTEEFHAYPGLGLLMAVRERVAADDARATLALTRRIIRALLTRSYRQNAHDWDDEDREDETPTGVMHPALERSELHRPYFEVLIVTGVAATRWPDLIEQWRRLRRPLDMFIYEPVFVGSFEDAFCAAVLNPDLAAVVIHEGFAFRSRHDVPVLRSLAEAADPKESSEDSALHLARVLKPCVPNLTFI